MGVHRAISSSISWNVLLYKYARRIRLTICLSSIAFDSRADH
jgi:hypothetical protein